ncbi:MAG: hypothetical protein COZ56_13275 [Armatimonadetes bacterium CG_4_8_14_3_um_filter_58_9]|nr:MAG: hypothetical protein COZ56_13275 [Armatimonadetes bacterium CG_4_8_14_3_um_filter_58_9]
MDGSEDGLGTGVAAKRSSAAATDGGCSIVPRLPRNVSGRDALLTFERAGFSFVRRTKKNHYVLVRGDTILTVPNHRRLKTGTLGQLVTDAGLTADQLIKLP